MFFYRQRNPVSFPVPTAVALPGNRAYVQFRCAPAITGQTMVSNVTQAQSQQIDYPCVTAKLRARRWTNRSRSVGSISLLFSTPWASLTQLVFAMNDTIMVVESR
eukprot:2937605-Pleurochrysis_carterae.AAC.1